jgi:hypothetical protein
MPFTLNPANPAMCRRCGWRVQLSELRKQVVAGQVTGLRVCRECFDQDNPQLKLSRLRVVDPQRVRDPKPPMEAERDV